MQFGIHLPHAGEQATPALIRRYALRAEALGFADVWVSEHIIVPRAQFPRSPLFYDPVLTLTWVAAVTERVRLGTSVIVLPMRHPLRSPRNCRRCTICRAAGSSSGSGSGGLKRSSPHWVRRSMSAVGAWTRGSR